MFAALLEEQGSVPSTHIRSLTDHPWKAPNLQGHLQSHGVQIYTDTVISTVLSNYLPAYFRAYIRYT